MSSQTLDCSDIDQYLGKPIDSSPIREPLGNNDIRRWVHAMHYPNLVHFDRHYAAESRWGKLVAPQSFPIVMDDGHGSAPACVGCIPNSHLLFAGDEWWFYGPRVFGGDTISNERIPFDYTVKKTGFGDTCFQRGDNFYRNQNGELIAKHIGAPSRSAVIGKAYRLGLEQRATYQRKPMVRAKKAAVRMMPTKATRVSLVPISAEPLPPPHVTDIPRVSMRDVTDHQCKWPCDEFRSMTAPLYCGCKKVEGLPYCESHARRAFQVPGMSQKQIANPRQPQRQMAIQGGVVADLRTLEEAF